MHFFKAWQDGNEIIVSSNTNWSCRVVGNCQISKNSGYGNDKIKIIIQKELPYSNGEITFSYGDERCDYPTIYVYMPNDCFIETIPSFSKCKEGNVLVVPFYRERELLNVTILSNGIWTIQDKYNCTTTISGDNLVIIPINKEDGYVDISPNIGCKYNFVKIKLKYSGD